jgi:hypothetical protein
MSTRHSPRSFGREIGVAFVLSLGGAAALALLAPLIGIGTAVRAVIALLGLAYVLYLIGRSGQRVGRLTTIACWIIAACAAWFSALPLLAYALVHIGLVWLVRSLYGYSGVLPALMDLGVSTLAAAFGAWAALRSGNAWLALWCFFLAQALHIAIPAAIGGRRETSQATDDAFARAHRAAEAALRRLSSAG